MTNHERDQLHRDIEALWTGKNVFQARGDKHPVRKPGVVIETFWDEKGALHCKVQPSDGEPWWCPVGMLDGVVESRIEG